MSVFLLEQAFLTLSRNTLPIRVAEMQNYVFVIDTNFQPLNPVSPKRARELLTKGKAAVFRMYPFCIILTTAIANPTLKPIELKIDPGAKVTGLALVQDGCVIWAANLEHRGQRIKDAIESRRAVRRGRRSRNTRYRQARFLNRKRPTGWLAPSLMHRVLTVETWVKRICRYAPITSIAMELVRFDLQKMQNPEISGVEYQQGELYGYEVREYLLNKWNRKCAYCDRENVPMEVEHIHPQSKGGSNRVSNLCLACHDCNQKKGNQSIEEFLKNKPELLKKIKAQAKTPLKDASAVNSTRFCLLEKLKETGLPVSTGTGSQTKYNRIRFELPKEHWIDAACVGNVSQICFLTNQPLQIKAMGWGKRQMATINRYGFPIGHRTRQKVHFGFQTGDIVRAILPKGKFAGTYFGRLTVRATGVCELSTSHEKISPVRAKYCSSIHQNDGYGYCFAAKSIFVQ